MNKAQMEEPVKRELSSNSTGGGMSLIGGKMCNNTFRDLLTIRSKNAEEPRRMKG